MRDDDCPYCGNRHLLPYDSNDLAEVIEQDWDEFVVLWPPETTEHDANYRELRRFLCAEAGAFLATG